MQGETKERWIELCKQAELETDPERLMVLIQEIIRVLDEKEQRLRGRFPATKDKSA